MKKGIALLLSFVLLGSVSAPALAVEESLEGRLSSVTLAVKDTLGIGDAYTEFSGDYGQKGTLRYWNLNWESETESLSVRADDSGKIYSYSRYQKDERYEYSNEFAPAFPAVTREDAKQGAQAFLTRVLGAGESVTFEAQNPVPAEEESYYYYGALRISGLETPVRVNLAVRTADLSVTSFSRDDYYTAYVGEIPSAVPALPAGSAKEQLRAKLELELRYVVAESDDAGARAVLRYVPVDTGSFVVDAKSGELINEDTLYQEMGRDAGAQGYGGDMMESAASDASDKATLTEAEKAGIKKLEGVRDEAQLDAAVRAMEIIGVTDAYALRGVDYNLDQETDEVTARLSYRLPVEEARQAGIADAAFQMLQEEGYTPYIWKYITVDAKTARLQTLQTYYSGFGGEAARDGEAVGALPAEANEFITGWHGTEYAQTAVYSAVRTADGPVVQDSYSYARTENGHFFPDDQLIVSVNTGTGYLDALSLSWTDEITFEDTAGMITDAAALASYSAALEPALSYHNLPVSVDPDDPVLRPFFESGYRYVYRMALVYSLESGDPISGINAKTGEILFQTPEDDAGITYSDISGSYAEDKVQELARYGVGYYGGQFRPYAPLTQRDMILLLVSAQGYRYDPGEVDDDALYSAAYNLNILDPSERDPDAQVTRAQMVKTIVKMSGYGKAAEFSGIYVCGFADDAVISDGLYGYVAIGKGLGILGGYADNTVRPNRTTTRMEAAVMLYNFMDRNR